MYDRIHVPKISLADMFDDAFRPIARDGAGNLEVMVRLQKAFTSIAFNSSTEMKELASAHAQHAYERAAIAMDYGKDLDMLKANCSFKTG